MTENNTKIPTWEQVMVEVDELLDEHIEKLKKVTEERDQLKTLYEHAQRELALAMLKIEELEKRG